MSVGSATRPLRSLKKGLQAHDTALGARAKDLRKHCGQLDSSGLHFRKSPQEPANLARMHDPFRGPHHTPPPVAFERSMATKVNAKTPMSKITTANLSTSARENRILC